MPNFIEIGWEIREKSRHADGGKEKKRKNKKNNKKQNKNRKVYRRSRQTLIIKTRIEPVGEPYREVCLSPLKRKLNNFQKPNWLAKCSCYQRKITFMKRSSKRMERWHSLWPQKVTGSLEFSDLLYDPKGHDDLCGRFDVIYDPKR